MKKPYILALVIVFINTCFFAQTEITISVSGQMVNTQFAEIELIQKIGSKVIAVAINTENCTDEEAYAYQKEYTASLGMPVLLPIQEGMAPIIPILKALTK